LLRLQAAYPKVLESTAKYRMVRESTASRKCIKVLKKPIRLKRSKKRLEQNKLPLTGKVEFKTRLQSRNGVQIPKGLMFSMTRGTTFDLYLLNLGANQRVKKYVMHWKS
jgi:hypothetical protein